MPKQIESKTHGFCIFWTLSGIKTDIQRNTSEWWWMPLTKCYFLCQTLPEHIKNLECICSEYTWSEKMSWHAKYPLVLVISYAKYDENPSRTLNVIKKSGHKKLRNSLAVFAAKLWPNDLIRFRPMSKSHWAPHTLSCYFLWGHDVPTKKSLQNCSYLHSWHNASFHNFYCQFMAE